MLKQLQQHIEQVFLGKSDVVRLCLTAFLAGEHLLLEDIPGVGKTLLAKALAKSIQGKFCRIQFTPDLLPAEITGSNVYAANRLTEATEKPFQFVPGPLFANIVLADEVNRATPRTQSAMLEAMGERSVSCDGETRTLPAPFFVIATQNPLEFEGTYPFRLYARQLNIPTFAEYSEVLRQADPSADFASLLVELMKAETASRLGNTCLRAQL